MGLRRDLARDIRTGLMAVNHGFNFLGVNLQSTDIDDSPTPADKMVAVPALVPLSLNEFSATYDKIK
jgi:hypothetical protein